MALYISSVIDRLGAWNSFIKDYNEDFIDLSKFLKSVNVKNCIQRMDYNNEKGSHTTSRIDMSNEIFNLSMDGWEIDAAVGYQGFRKNKVIGRYFQFSVNEAVGSFVYYALPSEVKKGTAKLGIILTIMDSVFHDHSVAITIGFNSILHQLQSSPLESNAPFLVLGLSEQDSELAHVYSIDNENSKNDTLIDRSIEFPPEYSQAGIGILSYFNKVLNEKYPNIPTKVKIVQDNLNVRMIIETESGHKETIEKALFEYGQVIKGDILPEDFLNDRAQISELKNELRFYQVRIENQKEIMHFQKEENDSLKEIIKFLTQRPEAPTYVSVAPVIINQNHNLQETMIKNEFGELLNFVKELNEKPLGDELQNKLDEAEIALVEAKQTSEEIKKSTVLDKVKNFIIKANEVNETGNKAINAIEGGAKLLGNIVNKYNTLANLLGIDPLS